MDDQHQQDESGNEEKRQEPSLACHIHLLVSNDPEIIRREPREPVDLPRPVCDPHSLTT
jgi:hypothetical protein